MAYTPGRGDNGEVRAQTDVLEERVMLLVNSIEHASYTDKKLHSAAKQLFILAFKVLRMAVL